MQGDSSHELDARTPDEGRTPAAVWLPALVAVAVIAFCWSREDEAPAGPEPSISAAAATTDREEPPERNAADPAPAPPPAASPAPSEAPATLHPPDAGGASAGWPPLPGVEDPGPRGSTFERAASRFYAAQRARLGAAAARHVRSPGWLAPFAVVAPADRTDLAAEVETFHARLVERVLAPAQLAGRELDLAPVELDWSEPSGAADAADPAAAADRARAWGEAWLAQAAEAVGARPPRWWREGAIEVARAATLAEALRSAPVDGRLAWLFDEERAGRGELATSGSFAAFCLGAAGSDRHRRETWLEFGRAGAAASAGSAPDRGTGGREALEAEIAARFGCTRLAELEELWERARRR